MHYILSLLLLVVVDLSFASSTSACIEASNCARSFRIDQSYLTYYSNYKLNNLPEKISEAIIDVHGALRDGIIILITL